jgi:phospholipase/lecithinase/hemolysin
MGLFLGSFVFSSHATFSSIYVWGDSLSATTTNGVMGTPQASYYYGTRYSNGRTWVEVLAERQGLGANSRTNPIWDYSSNNVSYYGHYSSGLAADIQSQPSAYPANGLFVVWVNNADFVGDMGAGAVGDPYNKYHGTNVANWAVVINQHLLNHSNFIATLYNKGCRTLIAPNAADVTVIPFFNNAGTPAWRAFVRQQIINFNASYVTMLQQISASSPGLKIYTPNIYSLLNNVLANASRYGLTNAIYDQGYGNGSTCIDALDAYGYGLLNNCALNGPGANYVFWDDTNPTAAMSEVIADFCQQYLSPVRIATLKQVNGSNRLDVANMPIGLSGCLDNSTNLTTASWTLVTSFTGLAGSQSLFVPTPPLPPGFGLGGGSGGGGGGSIDPNNPGTNAPSTNAVFNSASQFYRLRFPYAWNWP